MNNTQELDEMVAIFQDHAASNGYPMNDEHKRGAEIHKQAIIDWHNKQVEAAEKKAYQHAYMVMTDADLTEVQALDCLLKLSGNAGLIFSEAERNKLKEVK